MADIKNWYRRTRGIRAIYPKKELLNITIISQVGTYKPGINILGIICYSLILGVIIGKMGDQGKILKDFFLEKGLFGRD